MNLQATISEGNNEWVVFVNFPSCGCLWETIMATGEFNVVEFDVGDGVHVVDEICWKNEIVGWGGGWEIQQWTQMSDLEWGLV